MPDSRTIEKKCKNCRETFTTYISVNAKFCSKHCFQNHRAKAWIWKTCQNCGGRFESRISQQRKYCSLACKHEHHGTLLQKKEQRICHNCGLEFEEQPSKHSIFCSRNCFRDFQQKQKHNCLVCQRKVPKHQTYCSRECMARDYTSRLKGETNPNWRGGKNPRHSSDVSVAQRNRIFERDGYKCTECGTTEWEGKPKILHLHHIVSVHDGGSNDDTNIKVLCFICHWVGEHGYKINKAMQALAFRSGCRSRHLNPGVGVCRSNKKQKSIEGSPTTTSKTTSSNQP